MIINRKGNILAEVKTGIIVHGCNSQGVMGSGIAKQIKDLYPSAFEVYVKEYKLNGCLNLGDISYAEIKPCNHKKNILINGTIYTEKETSCDIIIVNAITQKYYGRDGKRYVDYEAVKDCFKKINHLAHQKNIKDINFPKIGAGLGGGDWNIISKIIDQELSDDLNKVLWEI